MDTAAKRASAVNISSPWRGILPFPDGVVNEGDRTIVAFMYSMEVVAVAAQPGRYQDFGHWPPQSELERQWRQRRKEEIAEVKSEMVEAKAADPNQLTAEEIQDIRDIYDLIRHS